MRASHWKLSESESVGIRKCLKLPQSTRIGKGRKLLRWESVKNCLDWKVSEFAYIGKCQKLFKLEMMRTWALVILVTGSLVLNDLQGYGTLILQENLTISNSDIMQSEKFLTRSNAKTFQSELFLTLTNSDTFQF